MRKLRNDERVRHHGIVGWTMLTPCHTFGSDIAVRSAVEIHHLHAAELVRGCDLLVPWSFQHGTTHSVIANWKYMFNV
jgi:hypothetical protein